MKRYRLGLALAGLTAVGLGLLAGAAPAFANTIVTGHAVGANFNVSHNGGTLNFWAGAYQTDKGLAFCLQPTRVTSVGQPVSDPVEMTSFTNDQGVALTTAQLNQLAYLTWQVSLNPSPSTADAIMYKLVSTTLLGYTAVAIIGTNVAHDLSLDDPGSDAVNMAAAAGVLDAARALLSQARAKANNWDGTGALTLTSTPSMPGDALTASVRLPGLGTGFPVVFTVTAPDGVTQAIQVATSGDVASLTYTTGGYGHYQITAQLAESAAPRYPLIATAMGQSQSMLMITGQARSWGSPAAAFDLTRPTPTITTSVSSVYTLPGETITDTVHLASLIIDDATGYQVTGGLFRAGALPDGTCPAASDPAWQDAEIVLEIEPTSVSIDSISDGTAELTLGAWQVPKDEPSGCLSYGETLTMTVDDSPAATVEHPAGDADQTTLVIRPPTIATHISLTALSAGDTVSDTVNIAALSVVPDVTYELHGQLLGLPAAGDCPGAGDGAWQGADLLAEFDGDIARDDPGADQELPSQGTWQVAAMTHTMCITYAETVTMTVPGHEPAVVEHSPGQPSQSALYRPFQATTGGASIGLGAKLAYALCGLGGAAAGTWLVRRFIWQA
ncbi:MAG: hypothetical protein FWF36_05590 [Propionibacteriaceae bacterium]|nr:hypothetical protein [Propionibacteriaceae bacterium]